MSLSGVLVSVENMGRAAAVFEEMSPWQNFGISEFIAIRDKDLARLLARGGSAAARQCYRMIEPPVATSKAEAGRSHGKPDEAPPLPQPPLLRPIATSRAHWGSGSEFMLACVGYAVGLGNVWRFPYLCYDNGGAAFLVPYFVVLLLLGLPLTILEMGMGQRFRRGPDALWRKVHPALGGLGSGGVLAGFVIGLYYNVIIGWALYCLWHSFAAPLPASSSIKPVLNSHSVFIGSVVKDGIQ